MLRRVVDGIKKGLSIENLVAGVISGLAGFGVPALIHALGAHVDPWSLIVLGFGSAFLVLGLLLTVRAKPSETEERITKLEKHSHKFEIGPSIPLGARASGDWYVSNEPPSFGAPPYGEVVLTLSSGSQSGERRLACEVSDPDLNTAVHWFWDRTVATHHLTEQTHASCRYPSHFFPEYEREDIENRFPRDGHYEVRWWTFNEADTRRLLATDTFEVRDGGLVQ